MSFNIHAKQNLVAMRFKLILKRKKESGRVVTLNYQKYITSWIYQTIYAADPFMAEKLQRNYAYHDSSYKLFTFSLLQTQQKTNVDSSRMLVLDDELYLTVSFYDDTYAEIFREGLQYNRELIIGNPRNHLFLEITRIELPLSPYFRSSMVFRTSSPITMGIHYGNCYETLHPGDEMYSFLIFRNLLDKSAAFHLSRSLTPLDMAINPDWKFEAITNPQKRRFCFHPVQKEHRSNLDGYHYTFRIEAPEELIKIGYYGGFGTHNAKGFGFVDVVRDSKEAFINKKSIKVNRKSQSR